MIAARDISRADALQHFAVTGTHARELLGQRDISMTEVATILGKVIGRSGIKYIQVADEQARRGIVQSGIPLDLADLILEMVHGMNSGSLKAQEPRSAKNTTPTSYETFAMEEFLPRFQQETLAAWTIYCRG